MEILAEGIAIFDDMFLRSEELIELAEESNWRPGTAGQGVRPEVRITDVHDLDPSTEIHGELLETVVSAINEYGTRYPQLKITGGEGLRVMRYPVGGFYSEHVDANGDNRVMSLIMFLNDDYEGGTLKFPLHDIEIEAKAGRIILFPSNYIFPHKVEPVTDGKKYSVISWFK